MMQAIKKEVLVGNKYIFHFNKGFSIDKAGDLFSIPELGINGTSIINITDTFENLYARLHDDKKTINSLSEMEHKLRDSIDTLIRKVEDKPKEQVKKRVNSKKKGSSNELKLSKVLTEKMKCQVYRSPGSGAYSTSHNLKGSAGDFLSEDIEAEGYKIFNTFNIEAKHYKELSLLEIYWKKSCPIIGFIEQASNDAKRTNKEFCLIIKSNNSPYFMILEENYCKDNKNKEIVIFSHDSKKYRIYLLEEFDFFL